MSNDLMNPQYTSEIAKVIRETQLITEEDSKFLSDNAGNFTSIMDNSYMWRTKGQKLSIISNQFFPTNHSKFHQAILEAKVQFTELMRLAVDAEKAKLDIEDLELDIQEIEEIMFTMDNKSIQWKKNDVELRRRQIDFRQKMIDLNHYKTAAKYRMKEVKQWKDIQDGLYDEMIKNKMSDEDIWNKESGELEDQFYMFLGKMNGIDQSTDAAEVANLTGLARFAVEQAIQMGVFQILVKKCNHNQLIALEKLGYITRQESSKDESVVVKPETVSAGAK